MPKVCFINFAWTDTTGAKLIEGRPSRLLTEMKLKATGIRLTSSARPNYSWRPSR
jgi:hypothetical protein